MINSTERLPDGTSFEFWEKENQWVRELYVDALSPEASDDNDGSREAPFRTIQAAADIATPGTLVHICPGIYRECVRPAMGGTDPEHMIAYEATEPGKVIIKASEVAKDFEKTTDWQLFGHQVPLAERGDVSVWCHRLDPDLFRGYNPFCAVNIIHDRLFIEFDKTDMTPYLNRRGMIFCDGKPLKQVPLSNDLGSEEGTYWVESNGMTVHFRLPGDEDPADHLIEISCREQCFAPEKPFLSYIKVKGLTCSHATMGAPIPQRGSISANRGHHWVIEDCTVDWSNATGIDIGNECWHHNHYPDQIIGYSVIRRCKVLDAGVCGIAGLFATHMLIEDNLIEGTGWQKMELSWEAGGLKFHNTVNSLFRRNVFRKTFRADHIWLDCGNENNRITRNLFLDGIEQREAIFIECTREGINLIDDNIFWNVEGRFDPAKIPNEPGSSGWYKMVENDVINGYAIYGEGTDRMQIEHNLIGKCRASGYYAKPVAFRTSSFQRGGTSRDAVFLNNMFYDCGIAAITMPTEKNKSEGNLFVKMGGGYLRIMYPAPEVCLDLKSWQEFYEFDLNGQEAWFDIDVDTEALTLTLRNAEKPDLGFGPASARKKSATMDDVHEVATDARLGTDFFGNEVNDENRLPGPFLTMENEMTWSIDPREL